MSAAHMRLPLFYQTPNAKQQHSTRTPNQCVRRIRPANGNGCRNECAIAGFPLIDQCLISLGSFACSTRLRLLTTGGVGGQGDGISVEVARHAGWLREWLILYL